MNPRLTLALLAGRGAGWISRRFGKGGGTVLPGHVIPRIDPDAVATISGRLRLGSVLVSGTNGKTTTTRMVSWICTGAGLIAIHNRSGANLMTGITAAAAAHASLAGDPGGDVGIFEVDEANVPAAAAAVRPRVLALMNIFRDQLDRYGEVELVAQTWRKAIEALPDSATLVLNADDPIVAQLGEAAPCPVLYFGVDDESIGSTTLPHEADRRLCHRCGARMDYRRVYYGHMGHYTCPSCGWERPIPQLRITDVSQREDGRLRLQVESAEERFQVELRLAGLYNAYNALAAAAICRSLGVASATIVSRLEDFAAVFGRQEHVAIGRGEILLNLVKNPVGFNQVLQAVFGDTSTAERPDTLLVVAINDLFADGTDISWLWDVDFEPLANYGFKIVCSGLRAHDMALRLKYAEIAEERIDVEPDLTIAVEHAVQSATAGARVVVCPTYTAMLEMRADLQRRGTVAPFWED
jgi:UDP-N-acetylmuramyl tripeptide synthase